MDRFLGRILPEAGRGFLEKMLRKKNIVLNGKKASGNTRLSQGDEVSIYFSEETFQKFSGEDDAAALYNELSSIEGFPQFIDVIFEDDSILILNKPAGVLSQRADKSDYSLNEYMLSYLIHRQKLSREAFFVFRPSVMNRLDYNTSGIVLAAKTRIAARKLAEDLKERRIHKKYRAIVEGKFHREGDHCAYILKDRGRNVSEISAKLVPGARRIVSEFSLVRAHERFSSIDAVLHTGRSHQLRAQLAFLGHPILLDHQYGDEALNRRIVREYDIERPRQLLHARFVRLSDGREFEAPLPEIFTALMGDE